MKPERVEKFRNLLELTEQYRRKNQYEYAAIISQQTACLIDECFETSLLGIKRCLARIKGYETRDEIPIQAATYDILGILCDLRSIRIRRNDKVDFFE